MALTVETSTPSPTSTDCDQDLAVFDPGGLDRPHFQGWPNGSMARGIASEDGPVSPFNIQDAQTTDARGSKSNSRNAGRDG